MSQPCEPVNPLDLIAAMLWIETKAKWHVRARGASVFHEHEDLEEAINDAVQHLQETNRADPNST